MCDTNIHFVSIEKWFLETGIFSFTFPITQHNSFTFWHLPEYDGHIVMGIRIQADLRQILLPASYKYQISASDKVSTA